MGIYLKDRIKIDTTFDDEGNIMSLGLRLLFKKSSDDVANIIKDRFEWAGANPVDPGFEKGELRASASLEMLDQATNWTWRKLTYVRNEDVIKNWISADWNFNHSLSELQGYLSAYHYLKLCHDLKLSIIVL